MAYLTMLNEMMAADLEQAVHQIKGLGIRYLDLKSHIFGHAIEDLDGESRERLVALMEHTGMEVYCLSSVLGHQRVDVIGQDRFRATLLQGMENLLETARIVRPTMIRLLACCLAPRSDGGNHHIRLERESPWVYDVYREVIDLAAGAGMSVTIENEPDSIFSSPAETLGFFERLNAGSKARYTWDIQNMWQSGVYPTLEVYRQLKPIINYVHLKGGRGLPGTPAILAYRSLLEEASWPVREITQQVLQDGISPIICLNTSHGMLAEDDILAALKGTAELAAEEARRNVVFLRRTYKEVV
jgi:sugar phosphate isomerase/epimerase